VRWYLPLHLPFLYFSIVATEDLITTRFWDIMKSYLISLIVLFPVFIWALWFTNSKGIFYIIKFNRFLGRVFAILLFFSFILWVGYKKIFLRKIEGKCSNILNQIFSSFIGISMFLGTWILTVITILYSRGLCKTYTEGGTAFTMAIPVISLLQQVLQGILR